MKRILAFLALTSCAIAGTWMASPGKGSHAAAGGGGTPAFVQSWAGFVLANEPNGTSSALTTTSGNLIVIALGTDTESYTISDSKSNTWVRAIGPIAIGGSDRVSIWYAQNITGGSGHTITITFSPLGHASVNSMEYSGCSTTAALDQTASGTGTGTALSTSATATTAQANEIIVGVGAILSPTSTWTAGASFTLRGNNGNDNTVVCAGEDRQVSSTGTYTSSFTFGGSSGGWACAVATFK